MPSRISNCGVVGKNADFLDATILSTLNLHASILKFT
jgi:hypothetical protein